MRPGAEDRCSMITLARFHARILEKARDNGTAPVLIVALGDSVTQGCMDPGRMDFEAVYHSRVKRALEALHPETTFSVLNAGIGGESAPGGLKRLDRDVIRHQPDLVIVGYGLNDSCAGDRAGLGAFREALSAIVGRIRRETQADVLLLTPNMMAARDNAAVPERWKPVIGMFVSRQTTGVVAAYAQAIRDVAAAGGAALADVYAKWEAFEKSGVDVTLRLCNGINHPDAGMHDMAAQVILEAIERHAG